ncbi:MAG: hypothetical protein M1818_006508 [Claussenomyces sp. TS43310]|nr:MAG: hypothetical protein M1818_006508 [Claussenomyces sp. TS43310]
MSKAPGTQLEDFRWDPHQLRRENQRPNLSQGQKEMIMQQLGMIASQLSNLQFNKIGSLIQEAGEYRVGKCLSPAFVFGDRETLGDVISRGPFEHSDGYYNAMLSVFLLHLQELRLEHNVFFAPVPVREEFETSHSKSTALRRWEDFIAKGSKIDSGRNRLDYGTAGYFCQQIIPFIGGESASLLVNFGDGFGLHHPDLSTSNIFVDDDLNITCVIDWAFASTVPMSTCLMTPSLPDPRAHMDSTLDSAFRTGLIEDHLKGKTTELADAKILAELWEHTRRAWLFTRLVSLDGDRDYYYFKDLYTSVYKPQEEVSISSLFRGAQKEGHLLELAETLADNEEDIPEILKEEEEYFTETGNLEILETGMLIAGQKLTGVERRAIARKITMVSELSQNFVADERLWRWIEDMMRDRACVEGLADAGGSVYNGPAFS